MQQYDSLHHLYLSTLNQIARSYEYKSAPRGQPEYEILSYASRLNHPRARYCYHPQRKQNLIFNYAQALWYLSGLNDLDFIAWYAPSMQRYCADGQTFPGNGYGKRLIQYGDLAINQLQRAIELLSQDRESKRVVLQLFSADENLSNTNIDVSCTLGLHLLIRENKLHMIAYMRANDAYRGVLNDIFCFTFMQEWMAGILGCELGSYHHHVGLIHVYQTDQTKVRRMLSEPHSYFASEKQLQPRHKMPPSSWQEIKAILQYEKQIRQQQLTLEQINQLPVHAYWQEILRLFFANHYVQRKEPFPEALMQSIDPFHRLFLCNHHHLPAQEVTLEMV